MTINLDELTDFLIVAKKQAYAGDGQELKPQRPGFKELEYEQGKWYYRDSYSGFFFAPGQEVVSFEGKPVWAMAYSGGMRPEYHGDVDFAKKIFGFLKKALALIEKSRPFRGPNRLEEGDLVYVDKSEGDIQEFRGREEISYRGKVVFRQDYIGGLIIGK
jgi:hypothetical protein